MVDPNKFAGNATDDSPADLRDGNLILQPLLPRLLPSNLGNGRV
jgi:hypothetical protein